MGDVRHQFLTGLSKPDSMKMGFDQVAISQFQRRRLNNPADHFLWLREVVLVVGALGSAVGNHQCSLTRSSSTPRALSVVGRCGWDIAEVDRVQRGNVYTQLHGRRTEQNR